MQPIKQLSINQINHSITFDASKITHQKCMSVFPTKKSHNQNHYIIIAKINYDFYIQKFNCVLKNNVLF
ncbi:hypothetical protein DP280_04625 [Escherichia coli]|nr:hypothetical protein [Escherichia coli]